MGIIRLKDRPAAEKELFIELLLPSHMEEFWPRVKAMLPGSLLLDYHTEEELLTALMNEKVQAWIIGRGMRIEVMLISEIVPGNRKEKIFSVLELMGSNVSELLEDVVEALEKVARGLGCTHWEIPRARLGWERLLFFAKPTRRWVGLEKEL